MSILSVLALVLLSVTMGLSLAHALEFPGKFRLDEKTYRAVQTIYYPGFTIGGLIGEFGSLVIVPVLLFLMPYGTARFWWTALALALLLFSHATYWLVTHPVNKAWLKDTDLPEIASTFFSAFAGQEADWKHMRNVWEYSHVARACLSMASLISMTVAVVVYDNR